MTPAQQLETALKRTKRTLSDLVKLASDPVSLAKLEEALADVA